MPFSVGQNVSIARLRKNGVITEVLSGGRYRVMVGSLPVTCAAEELSAVLGSKKHRKSAPAAPGVITVSEPVSAAALGRLDLHGLRVAEALERLEEHLSRAVLANLDRIEVIHGIGSGRVKEAVLKRLGELSIVARVAPVDGNAGTTIVYL
jgi:DNA mismatch repair protein MutS2